MSMCICVFLHACTYTCTKTYICMCMQQWWSMKKILQLIEWGGYGRGSSEGKPGQLEESMEFYFN